MTTVNGLKGHIAETISSLPANVRIIFGG